MTFEIRAVQSVKLDVLMAVHPLLYLLIYLERATLKIYGFTSYI